MRRKKETIYEEVFWTHNGSSEHSLLLTIASCPVLRLKPKSTSEETVCVQLTGNEGSDVNCAKWTAITGRQSASSKEKYELF